MSFRKLWNRHLLLPTFCVVAFAGVFAASVGLRAAGKMQTTELWIYDAMLQLQLQSRQYSAADDVAVIAVDEQDYHLLNHYPLTDGDKVALLKKLEASEPRAIGIDIYLDLIMHDYTKSKEDDAKDTRNLQQLLTQKRNIVCCYFVGLGTVMKPEIEPPTKDGSTRLGPRRVGCNDTRSDRHSVVRTGVLYLSDVDPTTGKPVIGQSLSLGVANQFLEATGVLQRPTDGSDPAHLTSFWPAHIHRFRAKEGGFTDVDDLGFQYLVDYRGPVKPATYVLRQVIPELFDQKALAELPSYAQRPKISTDVFRGKAILIGNGASSIRDFIVTPVSHSYEHFGVLQHASLVDQLIRTARGDSVPLSNWSNFSILAWAAFWGLAGVAAGLSVRVGFSVRAPWRILFLWVFGQAFIVAVTAWCFRRGVWVPMVPASFCWLLTLGSVGAFVAQQMRADRNALHSIFAGVVQKQVAEELWRRRDELFENGSLRPRKLIATVMFTDLMGFTSACERLDPGDVIKWINQYHEVMTRVVMEYNGVVIRYMGDGMMAVFGAPCADQVEAKFRINAEDAVNCALQMRREMPALHRQWAEQKWETLMMRVGIQSGVVLEGIVGSSTRFEYVTLGDTTNLASRLESYDKKQMDGPIAAHGCRILIGAPTRKLLSERIQVQELKPLEIKGKEALVSAFGVTGPVEPAPPSSRGRPADILNSGNGRAVRTAHATANQGSQ